MHRIGGRERKLHMSESLKHVYLYPREDDEIRVTEFLFKIRGWSNLHVSSHQNEQSTPEA